MNILNAAKELGRRFIESPIVQGFVGLATAPLDIIVSPFKGIYDWRYSSSSQDTTNPRKYALLLSRTFGLIFAAGLVAAFFIPIPGLTALYTMAAIPVMKGLVIIGVAVSSRTTGAIVGGIKDFTRLQSIENNFEKHGVERTSTYKLLAKTFKSIARISVLGGTVASMKPLESIELDVSTDKRPSLSRRLSVDNTDSYDTPDDTNGSTDVRPRRRP